MDMWGSEGSPTNWSPIDGLIQGSSVNLVCNLACSNLETGDLFVVLYPCKTSARIVGIGSIRDETHSLTILDAGFVGHEPRPTFEILGHSLILEHTVFQQDAFGKVLEVCSGIGVATTGFERVQMKTQVACELRPSLATAFSNLHPSSKVVVGDCCDQDTIRAVAKVVDQPGILFAGFNCQPYSKAGNQQGAEDSRSASLKGVLTLGYLLRCPIIVLECVVEAASNRHVRRELSDFCRQMGFCLSDVVLHLDHVWMSRRDRWWVVLSDLAIGTVQLRPLPQSPVSPQVREVVPRPLKLPQHDLDQLLLSPTEHKAFLDFQPCLSRMFLSSTGICPTALHSWGSQVSRCWCGCRANGLSPVTLENKGIFGILLPAPGSVLIDGVVHGSLRHPHPTEVALLTGMIPRDWQDPLRLLLAGLGQQASAIHALWVACHVKWHVDCCLFGHSNIRPRAILEYYLDELRAWSNQHFTSDLDSFLGHHTVPRNLPEIVVELDDIPVVDKVDSGDETSDVALRASLMREEAHGLSCIVWRSMEKAIQVIPLGSETVVVKDLVAAEVGLSPLIAVEVVDLETGLVMAETDCLVSRCIEVRQICSVDMVQTCPQVPEPLAVGHFSKDHGKRELEVISATIPFSVVSTEVVSGLEPPVKVDSVVDSAGSTMPSDAFGPFDSGLSIVDPLAALTPCEMVLVPPPAVSGLSALPSLTAPVLAASVRLQILQAQDMAWSDDEVRWHLHQLVALSNKTDVVVLDPLLASEAARRPCARILHQWFSTLPCVPKMIVSVLHVNGHWIPFIWTWTPSCLTGLSWDLPANMPRLGHLHDSLAKAVGARTYITNIHHRQFAPDHGCGVCSIRFVDNSLRQKMLPTTTDEVLQLHQTARELFRASICEVTHVSRPWLWGLGVGNGLDVNAHSRLVDLLTQHGVPSSELDNRVFTIVQGVGLGALQSALLGSAPWRSLKALANNARPSVQLVLPDELQKVIQEKANSGVGSAKKKNKGKTSQAKPAPARPPAIDPAKLVFDQGAFVTSDGDQLAQIRAHELGPVSSGVALVALREVEQFLKVGKPVSDGALAAFILNIDDSQLVTSLQWQQCRVALRCAMNGEPMLIHGFLVQLGTKVVTQSRAKHVAEVPDVQVACAKLTLYRDSIGNQWEEVLRGPVKFILGLLAPLQVCTSTDSPCHCSRWHTSSELLVRDPLLDVWRRQWLNLSFKDCSADRADLFVVNFRFVKQIESALLTCSGHGGLFIEPRSLDSRSAHLDYQVLWLPRSSISQLQHIKQTNPLVVGLARLGARLGLRVASTDIAELARQVKPDSVTLAAGPREEFELGPVPYGLDRHMVAKLCQSWGWAAKPINPARSAPNGLGTIWLIRACTSPPSSVFSLKGGEVVVSKVGSKSSDNVSTTGIVASSATMQLCSLPSVSDSAVDLVFQNDPWASAVGKMGKTQVTQLEPAASFRQVEERIERAVLAKLPSHFHRDSMEIDSGDFRGSTDTDARMVELESQVAKLTAGQQALDGRLDEHSRRSDAQISQMQHQLSAQGAQMEDLFRNQMAQIESLLCKKPRLGE